MDIFIAILGGIIGWWLGDRTVEWWRRRRHSTGRFTKLARPIIVPVRQDFVDHAEPYSIVASGAVFDNSSLERNARQETIFAWAKAAFTTEQATSLPQRGLRLLEEAVEAAQACGVKEEMAHDLVRFVFTRPPGTIAQELGGVGVTVLALAAAAGVSAEVEELREVHRVLAKPLEHFTRRNQTKNDAGFLAVDRDDEK